MLIYLQQLLSSAGLASRRSATNFIRQGKVFVNGKAAVLGQKIETTKDKILVNGVPVKAGAKVYYLLHKPVGYVSTVSDSHAHKKVVDLVPKNPKVWPIGRLDKDSSGLIILTNDGELTNKLTHPKFEHEKEYELALDKDIKSSLINQLTKGVKLAEGLAKADKIKIVGKRSLKMIIHQGWNRQLRRMLEKCGYRVITLKRTKIGSWRLGNLKMGEYRGINL